MKTTQQLKLARIYARTFLVSLSSPKEEKVVYEQVIALEALLATKADMWRLLRTNGIEEEAKRSLLVSIGRHQKWRKSLSLFLSFLLIKKRIYLLRLILQKFLQLYQNKADILTLRIVSSIPLNKHQKTKLGKVMCQKLKAKEVFFQPDEELLQDKGVIIFTNKGCLDMSMQSTLQVVKNQLLQA